MNAFPEILNHLFISVVFSHHYSAITSWLYLTLSPWKLIRIQIELVEVSSSGKENRLGYFNQLWSQIENRTFALGELKEMEMKCSQRCLCLFIAGVDQLSGALCQLRGIFFGCFATRTSQAKTAPALAAVDWTHTRRRSLWRQLKGNIFSQTF